mmetsp:Transcript_1319/g.3351  ORF Transcript_1319/g.3351 Transcript_1319/m.3351 type:complete len:392 (-) Transcript_1319:1955-3130(-)
MKQRLRTHRPQLPIPRSRTRPLPKPRNKLKRRKRLSERQKKKPPEKQRERRRRKKRLPGKPRRQPKKKPRRRKRQLKRPRQHGKRPRRKLVVRQRRKSNVWPCSEPTRRRKKRLLPLNRLHPQRQRHLPSRFPMLRSPNSKHRIIIWIFQTSRRPTLKCQKCQSFRCPKFRMSRRSKLQAFPLLAPAVFLLPPLRRLRYLASLLLPSVVAVAREDIRRSMIPTLWMIKKSVTKEPRTREQYLTKQMQMQRKLRTRRSNCELLPMRRRNLPKRPRMQRAKLDSVERFCAFDHLALDIRVLPFSIKLSRDRCHKYSLSSTCRRDNEKNSSTTTYTATFEHLRCSVVGEKNAETLNTTGTNYNKTSFLQQRFFRRRILMQSICMMLCYLISIAM